jgi:hypothetical protein
MIHTRVVSPKSIWPRWMVARAMGVGRNWYDHVHGTGAFDADKKGLGEIGIHFSGVKHAYFSECMKAWRMPKAEDNGQ